MFLQVGFVLEPPLTVPALLRPGAVTLGHVELQDLGRDELDLALGTLELTVALTEGWVHLTVQQVFVVLVNSLHVFLNVLFPHQSDVTQLALVNDPGVFLLQMPAVPRHSDSLETNLTFPLLLPLQFARMARGGFGLGLSDSSSISSSSSNFLHDFSLDLGLNTDTDQSGPDYAPKT